MLFPICEECDFYPCMCGKRKYVERPECVETHALSLETENARLKKQLELLEKRMEDGEFDK